MLALTTVNGNYHAYVMFVWIYGKDEDHFGLNML